MKVRLILETVTPLFLGGADQQPELRPTSMRGALRYWLRAGLGGVIDDADRTLLAEWEASIFGRTDRGSPVVVRLVQADFTSFSQPLLPHRDSGYARAVPTGTSFGLILSTSRGASPQTLEIATWSAVLALTLGGLGRRSRRGAGSVRLKTVEDVPTTFDKDLQACLKTAATTAPDGQTLADNVGVLVEKMRKAFKAFAPAKKPVVSSGLPSFSILRSDTRIVLWSPANTDLKDYKTILIPLMELLSSRVAANATAFRDSFGGIKPSRRASPLWATAHQLKDAWALVLTYLKAEIRQGVPGNPGEVKGFLDSLSKKWEAYPRPASGGAKP